MSSIALQSIVDASPRLDELSIARLIQLIAEAAHGKTVALSPSAVAIEPDATVKLDPAATAVRGYASPEKLKGGTTDRRSDVFSVGVMMWEALSHARLFEASSDEALVAVVENMEPRPPSENNANIPSELDAIVLKALARDPAGRYQSLKVMAAEIDAVLSDAGYAETNELIAKYLGTLARAPAAAPAASLPKVTPREPAKPSAADEAKKLADAKAAEAKKLEDAKLAERQRAAEARVAESKAAEARAAEQRAAELKKAEDARVAAADAKRKADDELKATEAKRVADAKAAEQKRAEEARIAEAKRKADEDARIAAEAKRKAEDEATKAEVARQAEIARLGAEEAKAGVEAAKRADEARAAEAKKSEEAVKAASAADAAKAAAAEAAAAIEAAKAAAAKAAEAIKLAETAEASKAAAAKAAEVAQAESVSADSAKHVAAQKSAAAIQVPRTISTQISEPKIDPTSFDPGRAALGAPVAAADVRPLSKADLNRTMLGVAPGPELVRPASASQPPPVASAAPASPAVLKETVVGLPAVPPGAETKTDIHDANTQRVEKQRAKSDTGGKKFEKNKRKNNAKEAADDSKTTKFEKGDPTPAPAPAGDKPADPAAVVALPRSDRASGKIDVWFSSTDAVDAVHEDDQFEPHKAPRNPLVYIGGAVGVAIIVIILAIAFSGGSKDKGDKDKKDGSGSAVAAAKPTEPVAPTPLVPDPNSGSGSAAAATPDVGSGSAPEVGSGSAGSGSAEVVAPPTPPTPPTPPAPLTPKTAGMACAATTECVDGLACTAGACKAAKAPVEPKKPPPPPIEHNKPVTPPPPVHQKPVDPYAATPDKPKADPQEALKTGLGQYARGETAAALTSFRSAIAASPGFAPAYRGMGLVYEKMGNKGQARIAYKKYLQLAPTAGDADQIKERMEKL